MTDYFWSGESSAGYPVKKKEILHEIILYVGYSRLSGGV